MTGTPHTPSGPSPSGPPRLMGQPGHGAPASGGLGTGTPSGMPTGHAGWAVPKGVGGVGASGTPAGGSGQGQSGAVPKRLQIVRDFRTLLTQNQASNVIEQYSRLNPRLKNDPELLFLYGVAQESSMRLKAALEAGLKAVAQVEHPDLLMLVARCYRALGETEKALAMCDRMEKIVPKKDVVHFLRGGILEEAGRFAEATALLEPYASRREGARSEPIHFALLHEWSKLLVQNKRFDEAIEFIDRESAGRELPDGVKNPLMYTKAKACDRSKRYEDSFHAADAANAIGRLEFSPELYESQVTMLIENWSREHMATFPMSTCESELPVFVAGMPRSGTSLIDQIIDAHPKASGVGELNTIEGFANDLAAKWDPDKPVGRQFGNFDSRRWTKAAEAYVKEITALAAPGTERVVNKALGNNKLVGLLARLYPKTRIIHAVRDPRDVAISCFMGGFNNKLHPWTTRLEWASNAWAQSQRMMDHWKASLDVPILDVNYERLVADPEREFPRIIAFLGLEWDDRCFDFHKSTRTVRTLSYDQVNRPLYTSSSGRHANYEKFIEGIEFPAYDPWAARDDD